MQSTFGLYRLGEFIDQANLSGVEIVVEGAKEWSGDYGFFIADQVA
jgi:hypothetical protein